MLINLHLIDNKRANQICIKKELDMKSYTSVKTWLLPFITKSKPDWDNLAKLTGMSNVIFSHIILILILLNRLN